MPGEQKAMPDWPIRDQVAGMSVGMLAGRTLLDLAYLEDSRAGADLNLVATAHRGIIEVQGTAERSTFSRQELDRLLDLAELGLDRAFAAQRAVLADRLAGAGMANIWQEGK